MCIVRLEFPGASLAPGEATRQSLVEDLAEAIDVGRWGRGLAADLLRGDVVVSVAAIPAPRTAARRHLDGNAEVGQVCVSVVVKQNVGRADVTMDDALAVGEGKRRADLFDNANRLGGIERPFRFEILLKAAAWQITHRQVSAVRFAPVVVERNDVWMLEARDDLRFLFEPADEFRLVGESPVNDFDGHLALQRRLYRVVDRGVRTLTDPLVDIVSA